MVMAMEPSLAVQEDRFVTTEVKAGAVLTTILTEAVAMQPLALVTVTVYVVLPAGVTVMVAVIAPVLHKYVPPPDAVRVAEDPEQIIPSLLVVPDVSAIVMDGVGKGLTVIVCEAVAEHPFALVTVTV